MAEKILQEYRLGDMTARYLLEDESGQVGFLLLPSVLSAKTAEYKGKIEPLVQMKVTGDIYNEAYAMGNSMRNSETVRRLRYCRQQVEKVQGKTCIATILEDDRGYEVTHNLIWKEQTPYVRMFCEFKNQGTKDADLEMFESFSFISMPGTLTFIF